MNRLKNIIISVVWIIVLTYATAFVLLKIPAIQGRVGAFVGNALQQTLGTEVRVGSVDVRLFNRVVVDNLLVFDQQNNEMLRASRVSAGVELLPLLHGEIKITSAQLFGMTAHLSRKDADSPMNIQFAIDALASKDTTAQAPLNLSIASLVIRNGRVTFDQYDVPKPREGFSPYHIDVNKISSHIILYKVTDESLHLLMKRLSLEEASGFAINNLKAEVKASTGNVSVRNFVLAMPESNVAIPHLAVLYDKKDGKIRKGSLNVDGKIDVTNLCFDDLKPLLLTYSKEYVPLANSLKGISLSLGIKGNDNQMKADLSASTTDERLFAMKAQGILSDVLDEMQADVKLNSLHVSGKLVQEVQKMVSLPDVISNLGTVDVDGVCNYKGNKNVVAKVNMTASAVKKCVADVAYVDNMIRATVETKDVNLSQLLKNKDLGNMSCVVKCNAGMDEKGTVVNGSLDGKLQKLTFKGYDYHDVRLEGKYGNKNLVANIDVEDPNIQLNAKADMRLDRVKNIKGELSLNTFSPKMLNLTDYFGYDRFAANVTVDMDGTSIDDAKGMLTLRDIYITNDREEKKNMYLGEIAINSTENEERQKVLTLKSKFADARMQGHFVMSKIPQSFTNLLAGKLTSIPGFPELKYNDNNFTVDARINNVEVVQRLTGLPLEVNAPISINGFVNSMENKSNLMLDAPELVIQGKKFSSTRLHIATPDDRLSVSLGTAIHDRNGKCRLDMECVAEDNDLYTVVKWDNLRDRVFKGRVSALTHFYTSLGGNSSFEVTIPPSVFEVNDTLWTLHTDGISYEDDKLIVDRFVMGNSNQNVMINGVASKAPEDSVVVNLNNVNVNYVLDLVNFHSVEFEGNATGRAVGYAMLDDLKAKASLEVSDFVFDRGRLGTLFVDAGYSVENGLIELDAVADDKKENGKILINGHINPKGNSIDLKLQPENARLDFLSKYCGSFLEDIDLRGTGALRLYGPFNGINLTGEAVANGSFTLSPTNCRYTMVNDTVKLDLNRIWMNKVYITDEYGNVATLTGGIKHVHLGRMTYDFDFTTGKFLVFNQPDINDSSFGGYAVIAGDIGIHGKGNELNITAEATTLKDSYFIYDASTPDAITEQDFITWGSAKRSAGDKEESEGEGAGVAPRQVDIAANAANDRTNIRMNFVINTTPDFRLHLLMDAATKDYIEVFGSGVLGVNYFNKGSLDIFGNYVLDHGIYKMTIQNLLRRDFMFQKGGTVAFGGDPYNAILNLQAAYMLNSVSLADLNIGNSFKSNNVPVNCLMNITGTPGVPKVAFDLDLPSLSSDARQMVYSVINSEEEMNQQVLYLLGVGRFYSQANVDNTDRTTSQSALAVQSFLSGTISQQINNVLNQVVGINNWSFGANITPGADGFNNAEYQGTLSGKLFNNRLILNGQFGYRDNVMKNSQSFIGDFSLQYLLTPNGNYSLKVYNQANDRYFTKNSLNTQGIGFVIQREFGK